MPPQKRWVFILAAAAVFVAGIAALLWVATTNRSAVGYAIGAILVVGAVGLATMAWGRSHERLRSGP